MRKTLMGRLLGLTLAVIMGVSSPVMAYAQEEVGGLISAADEGAEELVEAQDTFEAGGIEASDEVSEEATEEDASEVEITDEEAVYEADDSEAAIAQESVDSDTDTDTGIEVEVDEDSTFLGSDNESNLIIEFVGFGDEADSFIKKNGQDAFYIRASRCSDEVYYLDVLLKMWPSMANGVLEYVTCNDSDVRLEPHFYDSYGGIKDCLGVDLGKVPVEYITSGEKLTFYAHWTKNILDGCTLYANGGVFDDAKLYDGGSLTYTFGDSKSIKPVEGNDNNTTVDAFVSEDKSIAYVPVMQNGFLPLPKNNEGISMDLAGRPYEGDTLPLIGWNTKKDGSGEMYTGDQILLKKDYWHIQRSRIDLTLYAIFPEYYGAEFILDGKSYVGDYWIETPNGTHTESINNLMSLAFKGKEDILVKEGYTISWYLNEYCTIPADLSTMIDDCDNLEDRIKVYGKWTEIVPEEKASYGTVFFKNVPDADEGVMLGVGETLDLSKYVFTKKGYTFKNWTATIDGKTKSLGSTAKITKCFKKDGDELTLTANWTLDKYKITYALNGGTQAKNAPKNYNVETQVQLPTPSKKGYVFEGWDVKVNGKDVTNPAELALIYDAEKNVIPVGACGNLTLSAKFVPFGFKILFHVDGVDAPMVIDGFGKDELLRYTDTVDFNVAAMDIEEELGWHETKPGENNQNRDKKIVGFSKTKGGKADFVRTKSYTKLTSTEEELHLYAILENETYYINYHLDDYQGATLTKPLYTFKSGNKKFKLPTANCPGFKFVGWEFDQSRNSDISMFYSTIVKHGYEYAYIVAENVNNDIEVWPCFEANKIKVYVSPNGSGVYEDVDVETYYGTDTRSRKVTGKRAFGEVYYGSGILASDWYNESMNSWYRPGYDFVGYSKNPKATSKDEIFTELYYSMENFCDVATSGSGTIYCIWKKSEIGISAYPATLIHDGEVVDENCLDYECDALDSINLNSGKTVTLPKATLEGYDFLGWKPYRGGFDRFNKVTMKNGYVISVNAGNCYDIEIYPEFRRCTYNLVVNTNGGTYGKVKSVVVAKDLDYSDDVSELLKKFNSNTVTRKGYTLMGFAKDAKGATGIVLGADGKPVYKSHYLSLNGSKKVTLYAIWEKN